ncbi:hypothetical protein PPERSA_02670 [Pseudocohnilembus persalinus]|uniref:Uncharacterized protein n=1 Tax=Pseudocohnilembus persalinus TaxID=266149 RepID=A0A0V0R5M1_PSEPJ|nr:hypothetical protein PPERSA_02670 [Pseudocohnilembus persalinus]|eukprot:KRX09798.1 hypothetical protein PPERSA_02670 [Pseudocohnilembus persalinus]
MSTEQQNQDPETTNQNQAQNLNLFQKNNDLIQLEEVAKNYNVPESQFREDICQEYDEIHDNIERVHTELIQLFSNKEKELLDLYKRKMTKAQQREKELTESTSETELKNKMIEKKEKLQKERQKFLETSIYFSDKCKKFKETLTKVVGTTKDLESEIQFLNEQIIYAEKHNEKLKEELKQVKEEVVQYDANINFEELDKILSLPNKDKLHQDLKALRGNTLSTNYNNNNYNNNYNNNNYNGIKMDSQKMSYGNKNKLYNQNNNSQQSFSQQANTLNFNRNNRSGYDKYISPYSKDELNKFEVKPEDIQQAKEELRRQKEINQKLNEFLNDECFQETEFERIFLECVQTVKARKNNGNTNQSIQSIKLPQLSNNNNSNYQNDSQRRANESTLDFTSITDFDFNGKILNI